MSNQRDEQSGCFEVILLFFLIWGVGFAFITHTHDENGKAFSPPIKEFFTREGASK